LRSFRSATLFSVRGDPANDDHLEPRAEALVLVALEQLVERGVDGWYVTRSLVWAVLIVAVFAPLAVARFGRG
jgi:hypothetical protein